MNFKEKEDILLLWFESHRVDNIADGYKFAKLYKFLFGDFPYWYARGPFYRDHGFVGLRGHR